MFNIIFTWKDLEQLGLLTCFVVWFITLPLFLYFNVLVIKFYLRFDFVKELIRRVYLIATGAM